MTTYTSSESSDNEQNGALPQNGGTQRGTTLEGGAGVAGVGTDTSDSPALQSWVENGTRYTRTKEGVSIGQLYSEPLRYKPVVRFPFGYFLGRA